MSRRIKIQDEDWGEFDLFILSESEDGSWDDQEWEKLKEWEEVDPLIDLFSRVTWESYQDALNGYAMPLIEELELKPESCLIKADLPISQCFYWNTCPAYDEDKCFGHKDPPACYNASIEEAPFDLQRTVSDIYRFWQDGTWIVIVEEDTLR